MFPAVSEWFLSLVQEPVYWLWCRWRGHGAFSVTLQSFTKRRDAVLTFRVCDGCGRVYEEDVWPALDMLERDLNTRS